MRWKRQGLVLERGKQRQAKGHACGVADDGAPLVLGSGLTASAAALMS
jgi:hypothetical protein